MTADFYVRDKKGSFLLGLSLFFLLLLSRNTMISSVLLGFYTAQFLMLGVLGLLGLSFLIARRARMKEIFCNRRMVILLFWAVALLLPMVLKRDFQMMYLSIYLCVLTAVLFSYLLPIETLARYFVAILLGLSVYALLATYVLRPLVERGFFSVPRIYNSMDVEYYHFLFCFPSVSFTKYRNLSLFREPGVYHCFLMLALYLNFFQVAWETKKKMWLSGGVLTLAMLTTMSTAGYVELVIFFAVIYLREKLYRNRVVNVLLILLLAVLVLGFLYLHSVENMLYWELYGMFVSKFQPGEESGADRIGSVLVNLSYFLHSPLVGAKAETVLYAVLNNTSSTTLLFALCGGLAGLANLLIWGMFALAGKDFRLGKCFALLSLLIAFNTQNLTADLVFWLFPIVALAQRERNA